MKQDDSKILLDLTGFIIGRHNLNNIGHGTDGQFRKETERTLNQGSKGKQEEGTNY